MAFVCYLRSEFLSWSRNTPLPENLENSSPIFQPWHHFDVSHESWTSIHAAEPYNHTSTNAGQREEAESRDNSAAEAAAAAAANCPSFSLVTWNVDSASAAPVERIAAVLCTITASTPPVDVIFLQEVSRDALRHILGDAHIRRFWYSSECDDTQWQGQLFATMTLLSKRRFGHGDGAGHAACATLGPLWRLKYPSRFGRDALCSDVFVASTTGQSSVSGQARVRLINVHLDSLPIKPSKRPQQIATVASLLRSAGRGVAAGDFNPVLPEDGTLVADNHLVDAWLHLMDKDPGFTWGIDELAAFPPCRLDKVVLLGLRPHSIELMHPGKIHPRSEGPRTRDTAAAAAAAAAAAGDGLTVGEGKAQAGEQAVPWSDHSGIKCSFGLVDD
ncbi:hypothetical protein E4U43_003627 [Claviceps pusilla]|uniref:Endonuclease/exonuclease/phosphatase domain-containing protein n=1 Tax=Claviceps pusilla TaxID=123648 RepID=A0A9P7T0H5_9HYPO|nr:hypothetical protein E4U43_003627 [Claviceps pusilla]